ncbi:MAG: DUF881 domain-containing protein [Anaerolineae bacterium]|nr:DUF881 domain-containing protein [Anaerolineae bacterium]
MLCRKWVTQLSLTVVCLLLGLLLVVQFRSQSNTRPVQASEDWERIVVDLIDNNMRLREEIRELEAELVGISEIQGRGALLQSLVDEANQLRIANGMVEVSGPGVEVVIDGPLTVLDLQDLVNEIRNAGAEALAVNGRRIVAWSAISTDGVYVTVDGQPVLPPYRLEAIGDAETMSTAIARPGGLVDLLQQADERVLIGVNERQKITLPVYDQPFQFVYAKAAE